MESLDLGVVGSLVILEFFAILINGAYAESPDLATNLWSGFGWWVEKIGIVSVLVTLLIYLHEQKTARSKEKDFRKERFDRSCVALLREVTENRDSLNRFDRLLFSYVKSKNLIDYSNVVFETYAYQSIIHSGLLTYFGEETQARMAQLYSRIDSHNETLNYRVHLETEFILYGRPDSINEWRQERERYDMFLTETDGEIKQLFPDVEKSLQAKTEIGTMA